MTRRYPAVSWPGYACNTEEFPVKKQRKSAAGQAAHADVYQIVTDRIIAALEQGTAPWRRPWRCVDTGDPGGLPSNALTGRCYSGVDTT
ncbi:DUF1738 domain-containing protein [Salmonella enterica]|nr:DUF1738 domain-containing protein [Salmonella enterica]EKB5476234.1 DUF1738 domain-containing protein [Salmonella enterica]ELL0516057.1 DUF1738 domain-containing protein [Salmonella enterica]